MLIVRTKDRFKTLNISGKGTLESREGFGPSKRARLEAQGMLEKDVRKILAEMSSEEDSEGQEVTGSTSGRQEPPG